MALPVADGPATGSLRPVDGHHEHSVDPDTVRWAITRADRICLLEPACRTWIGDRLRARSVRIKVAYGLDLATT